VVLSVAVSVDGYLDDGAPERLLLSNGEDFDRVDGVRAGVDAILVGANTIRRDNPRLRVRDAGRVAERVARGVAAQPVKVTVTRSGEVDPGAEFFVGGERLVYSPDPERVRARLGAVAEVVGVEGFSGVLDDLGRRGVARLLVEGGGEVHTQFLADGLADELQLVIAPLLVGDPAAPRFVHSGQFPGELRLDEVRRMGDVVLLRYLIGR
jgi:5-amino-6-(5-phosphoribosylamino)uracil reductase